MAAKIHALTADQGATFRLSVRYRDPAGVPIDLSGYTAAFVRLPNGEGAALSTHAATTDADGWITVAVADEDTALWPDGKVRYRLELENASGEIDYLLIGPLTVRSHANA